jgi:hypothetical protein
MIITVIILFPKMVVNDHHFRNNFCDLHYTTAASWAECRGSATCSSFGSSPGV